MNLRLNFLLVGPDKANCQDIWHALLPENTLGGGRRVTSLPAFYQALAEGDWDVVLFVEDAPGLSVTDALHILQTLSPLLPLIRVADKIGEEEVADLFKRGAADFVLKGNFSRLKSAIERCRAEAAARRARRRAEITLAHSEAKYRNLFESSRDATITTDIVSGIFTSANPAALRMFGARTETEFIGLTPAALSPDFQPDGHSSAWHARTIVETVLRTGSHSFEWTHRRLNGGLFECDVLLTRMEIGGTPHILGTIRDISDRKRAEILLQESEQQFRATFETAAIGMAQAEPHTGRFIRANHHMCGITGYSEAELQSLCVSEITHPDDRKEDWELFQKVIRREAPDYRVEKRYLRKGGTIVWVSVTMTVIGDRTGQPVRTIAVIQDITARKAGEHALRDSRAKLEAALASMTDGVFISDPLGQLIDFNQSFATFCKFKNKSETLTKLADYPEMFEVRTTAGEPVPMENWAVPRALRGETGTNVEFNLRRKDTGETWVGSYSFSPIRDKQGAIAGAVVVARDVSERKREEQALRMAQFSMEHSGDAILWTTPDATFVRVNEAATTLLGYTRAELLDMAVHDISPTRPASMWAERWQELRQKKVVAFESSFRTRDGGLIAVEVTANHLEFENQEFNCAFVRDITERKTKTEELRWKTAFLEALVHSSADGIAVVDNQSRKILQNQKMRDLWKIPAEIARQPDSQLEDDFVAGQTKNPGAFAARVQEILAHPDDPAQDEIELHDGTVLNRHTSLVRDDEGKSYGRVWTCHDITNRRQLETQVRQTQKMEAIGTLAGGIAHDFNNILCSIFGYGYLLQREVAANPPALENLEEILRAANRAKDLVHQILAFSRQREQKRESIRLTTVIKEAMKFLRASLPANIQFVTELDEDAPAVFADPTQMYQVTMNLATNALHAMEGRPGRLVVRLTEFSADDCFHRDHPELKASHYTRLTITDTGTGMDAKTRERIFEPFFTTKPIGKGTGLGLSVVHGIVQSHEGLIIVTSAPGEGTTFDLYFPAQRTAAVFSETKPRDIPRGNGQNILFVDDEPPLTLALKRLLEGLNYHVTTSNSAREAVSRFAENPDAFSLVITDLAMPEMNGVEVAREIHALRPGLPVILVSGHAPDFDAEKIKEKGLSGMLEKPFSLPDLAAMVSRVI